MQAGGWDAPHTRTSTHRAQDFTEDSRAIERFIKQKKTSSVCRLGAHKKSGKTGGSRETQVRSHSLPKCSEEELELLYKEYFPSSLEEPGENRPPTGAREYLGGGSPGGLEFLPGAGCWLTPPQGGGLLAQLCTPP